ncbi:MAG: hypothetical protein KAS32_06300 [Candidatus Peribacteraceae bacterium]|nr:hypothetical protein [Candidatus Peribacteraceae bacterium]
MKNKEPGPLEDSWGQPMEIVLGFTEDDEVAWIAWTDKDDICNECCTRHDSVQELLKAVKEWADRKTKEYKEFSAKEEIETTEETLNDALDIIKNKMSKKEIESFIEKINSK